MISKGSGIMLETLTYRGSAILMLRYKVLRSRVLRMTRSASFTWSSYEVSGNKAETSRKRTLCLMDSIR